MPAMTMTMILPMITCHGMCHLAVAAIRRAGTANCSAWHESYGFNRPAGIGAPHNPPARRRTIIGEQGERLLRDLQRVAEFRGRGVPPYRKGAACIVLGDLASAKRLRAFSCLARCSAAVCERHPSTKSEAVYKTLSTASKRTAASWACHTSRVAASIVVKGGRRLHQASPPRPLQAAVACVVCLPCFTRCSLSTACGAH